MPGPAGASPRAAPRRAARLERIATRDAAEQAARMADELPQASADIANPAEIS